MRAVVRPFALVTTRARLQMTVAALQPTYASRVDNSSTCLDMRSDTVSLPSQEMKEAMITAPLGDDVYGEDPTVESLQQRCAELFGKEDGLFVASGTMGNLLAVMAHCQHRGDEIIVGKTNHIHRWEQGNYAQLAGVSATTLEVNADGTMNIADIEDAIRVEDCHMPVTRLVCVENTHNYSGGKALPLEYLRNVRELADKYGLRVHMDGARIYNAAVALGVDIIDIAKYVDSVQMCFSKGLGAPVGSILVGTKEVIEIAHRKRKAGMLAAAAHVALNRAVETITIDHQHARQLADGINEATPETLRGKVHANSEGITNMVLLTCGEGITPQTVIDYFQKNKILMMAFDNTRVRIVLNWGVDGAGVERTIEVYKSFLATL